MFGAIQLALTLLAFPLAWRWGGWPERAGAAVLLGSVGLHRFYHWLVPGNGIFETVDFGHLTLDAYLLAGFLTIALKADRQWPLWVTAAQLMAILGHFVRLITGDIAQLAYAIMTRAPSWLQVTILLGGIAFAAARRRRAARRSVSPWSRSRETEPKRWPSG